MKAHEIPAVKEKPFWKDYIFHKFFIKFPTAFVILRGLGAPLLHHIFPKAAAIVIKQFRKAAKKLRHFISSFRNQEIGFRNKYIL
jgi:hypothetical protein